MHPGLLLSAAVFIISIRNCAILFLAGDLRHGAMLLITVFSGNFPAILCPIDQITGRSFDPINPLINIGDGRK